MSEQHRPLPVGVWHEEKKPEPVKEDAAAQSGVPAPETPAVPEPRSEEKPAPQPAAPEPREEAPQAAGKSESEQQKSAAPQPETDAAQEPLSRAARRAARSGRQRVESSRRIRIAAAVIAAGILIAACALLLQKKEGSAAPESSSVAPVSSSSVPEEPEDDPLSPADPDLWSLLLANTEHPLPEGYEPELADTGNGQYVDERILQPLKDMFAAAEEDGIYLYVRSAYRSEETQAVLFEQLQQEYMAMGYSRSEAYDLAKKLRNLPGTSEHQTGLAVDIVSASNPRANLVASLAETDWAKWLRENAADYGFILRYPEDKTAITGTSYEPWHYRYVGVEDAQKIMAAGLCLEEYLGVAEKEESSSSSAQSASSADVKQENSSASSAAASSSSAAASSASASSAASSSGSAAPESAAPSDAVSREGEKKA